MLKKEIQHDLRRVSTMDGPSELKSLQFIWLYITYNSSLHNRITSWTFPYCILYSNLNNSASKAHSYHRQTFNAVCLSTIKIISPIFICWGHGLSGLHIDKEAKRYNMVKLTINVWVSCHVCLTSFFIQKKEYIVFGQNRVEVLKWKMKSESYLWRRVT